MISDGLFRKNGFDIPYLITVCTARRAMTLGRAENGTVFVNEYGFVAYRLMGRLDRIVNNIRVENYTVMPNHIHMLVCARSADGMSILPENTTVVFGTVAAFKHLSASLFTDIENPGPAVPRPHRWWQYNYTYNRLRSYDEYLTVSEYINNNPSVWDKDMHNPVNPSYSKWKDK